jgi:2-C-methyl-D-erythritol 4-phosphate cytidylyltransferase
MLTQTQKWGESPCWAVVVAGGRGMRMGGDQPKQYLAVLGKTIIEHTLDRVCRVPTIDGIIVTLRENDTYWQQLQFHTQKTFVTVADSGGRCQSVLTALRYLSKYEGLPPDARILVHDGVRPCVRVAEFEYLIENTRTHAVGGVLVSPDDVNLRVGHVLTKVPKSVEDEGSWHALTPQVFRLQVLAAALEKNSHSKHDAEAVLKLGLSPLLFIGSPDNVKVTYPGDLEMVERYLLQQREDEN